MKQILKKEWENLVYNWKIIKKNYLKLENLNRVKSGYKIYSLRWIYNFFGYTILAIRLSIHDIQKKQKLIHEFVRNWAELNISE